MSGSPPPAAAFSNSGGGKKAVHVKVSTSGGHCVVGFILANIRNRVFWGQGHMTWSRDHHLDPHIKRKRGKERVKTGAGHRERWTEAMLRYKHTYNSTWLFVGFPRPATTPYPYTVSHSHHPRERTHRNAASSWDVWVVVP